MFKGWNKLLLLFRFKGLVYLDFLNVFCWYYDIIVDNLLIIVDYDPV
jgi:hypothetical protein